MKKLVTTLMIALSLAGCSSNFKTPEKTYEPYGLINESNKKSDKVCYETNIGDVALGVIFFETIVAPIWVFGFDVEQPTSMKDPKTNDCK